MTEIGNESLLHTEGMLILTLSLQQPTKFFFFSLPFVKILQNPRSEHQNNHSDGVNEEMNDELNESRPTEVEERTTQPRRSLRVPQHTEKYIEYRKSLAFIATSSRSLVLFTHLNHLATGKLSTDRMLTNGSRPY